MELNAAKPVTYHAVRVYGSSGRELYVTQDAVGVAFNSAKHLAAEAAITADERLTSLDLFSHDNEIAVCMYWLMAFGCCPDT